MVKTSENIVRILIGLTLGISLVWNASAQSSVKPIRIGINLSITGFLGENIKTTMYADELWEKQINTRGGLLGRRVELTFSDNKSNPDNAVAIYERMVQDDYDFIFEDSGALIVQRESTLAEQRKRLFLVPNGFARSLYERGYKYLFFTAPSVSEDLNIGLVRMLESLPPASRPKSIAYSTVENIASTSITRGLQEMVKGLDMAKVLDVSYPSAINDATPIVNNLKQKEPEFVFQTGFANDTLLFIRAVKQQDLKYKLLAIGMTAGALPNFVPSLGAATVENMIYTAGWDPALKTPGNQAFVKAYMDFKGVEPTYNSAQGWARWQILEQAINATKSLNDDILRDYISRATFVTILGTVKFNDKGYISPTDTLVMQFQGGKRVIVWPKQFATGQLVYPNPIVK